MINILMYSNNMCCEAPSIHRKYTKYTRKQAHKQVLAVYFHHTYKTRRKELFLLLLPKSSQLTISLVSLRLKTVDAQNTFHNSYIKIITIKPTMKSNTRTPFKACHKFTSLVKEHSPI